MSFKGYKYLSLFIFYVFEYTFLYILVSLMKAKLCCISKHGSMNFNHFCFYFALKYMTGAINEAGEANDIVNPFLISNAYFQS